MWELAAYRVTHENILNYVGFPPMENIIHYRQLTRAGTITIIPLTDSLGNSLQPGLLVPAAHRTHAPTVDGNFSHGIISSNHWNL